jgi:hypothetical protein
MEAFLMAEDIRLEKNGLLTLVGVFADQVFAKIWPLQLPKLCFHVRVRHVEGKPEHRLTVVAEPQGKEIASLVGPATPSKEQTSIFNYFFAPGPAFQQPGSYHAKFSLHEGNEEVLQARYEFRLVNPNPQELYVKCIKCEATFGTGVVAKDASGCVDCATECPKCKASNLLDRTTAFHLPNPTQTGPEPGGA